MEELEVFSVDEICEKHEKQGLWNWDACSGSLLFHNRTYCCRAFIEKCNSFLVPLAEISVWEIYKYRNFCTSPTDNWRTVTNFSCIPIGCIFPLQNNWRKPKCWNILQQLALLYSQTFFLHSHLIGSLGASFFVVEYPHFLHFLLPYSCFPKCFAVEEHVNLIS